MTQVLDPTGLPDQGWGPTRRGGHRRWRRALVVVLVLLLVLPVAQLGAAAVYAQTRITRAEVAALQPGSGPWHVLIVGSDSREGLSPEERRELRTGSVGGDRTDTIFILTIHEGRAGLLAFPRDLHVTRCDGSTGRINAAEPRGGPGCLVQTISEMSGIAIDHYARIEFGGFRRLVDAVGGVELCLDDAISDRDAGIDLPAGCQLLDGKDALGYVRVRKIDNDLMRIERQQQFLKALADKVATPATALNPLRLFPVAGAAGDALTVNDGMGTLDLLRLARAMRTISGGGMTTAIVPARPATIGGAAVLVPTDEAAAVYAAFASGEALREAPDDSAD